MTEPNPRPLVTEWTLLDVLRSRGVEPTTRGVAVAVGDTVIPRSSWAQVRLNDGDRIEVVTAVQGG
jgi:sulfur carrier protein